MLNKFSHIANIIKDRRSIKPSKMNGKKIPDELVKDILRLADWAPTHGRTEPWRFVVYSGSNVKEFCWQHAELYRANATAETFKQESYDKLLHNGDLTSHIVIAIMQRGNLPKIPALEEIVATSAAIQNLLLGATALGLASFLSTGGLTHHLAMKEFLHLRDEDIVIGIIYLGYSDEKPEGKRTVPLDEKVKWVK